MILILASHLSMSINDKRSNFSHTKTFNSLIESTSMTRAADTDHSVIRQTTNF